MRVFGLPQPLPGDVRSNDVTSGSLPVTRSRDVIYCTLVPPPASHNLVGSETHSMREFLAFYSHFQVTFGQMTSVEGHFRSPEVT